MKSNIKHNKLKNTGILFELLARQITSDILNNKTNSKAIQLMKEFFASHKELGQELMLYRTFFNVHNLTEVKAFQLLHLVCEQRKKIDQNALNLQKYLLIREIKNSYDIKEFFSMKIPSYKVYASIYKVFDSFLNGQVVISEIEDLANSQFTIVEHLSGKGSKESQTATQLSELMRGQDSEIRYLSYKILVDKFNEKYKELIPEQKQLLQTYIYSLSNSSDLKDFMHAESKKLSAGIQEAARAEHNKVVKIKLNEVASQLNRIGKSQTTKENHVTAILIAYEILKELKHNV